MKIAIVGNGASLLKTSFGRMIDNCDEVIRFNDYKIKGYERHVGTKTTIWARNTGKDEFVLEQDISTFTYILVQHTRFKNEYYDPTIIHRPKHIPMEPKHHDEICKICHITGLNTSTGIQAISHCLGHDVWICGFDCFYPPRKYFEPPVDLYMPHSTNESLYIKHLLNQNLIHRFVHKIY